MHGAVLFNSLNLGETVTIGNFHTRNFAKKGEKDTTNYTDQVGWACPTLCGRHLWKRKDGSASALQHNASK